MKRLFAAFALILPLCGCTNFPYKIEIRQGNDAAAARVGELKIGMTQPQVRALLGTPQTVALRNSIWYYVFQRREAGKLADDRRLELVFANGGLTQIIEGEQAESP